MFHNAKYLAIAINIEDDELLELCLSKTEEDANVYKVKEEVADVFSFAFMLAHKYNLDVKQIVLDKLEKSGVKYPVEKSKGGAKKYEELD